MRPSGKGGAVLCFWGQIPPVGNFAKIRARGRGGLQLRGERIRPPPPPGRRAGAREPAGARGAPGARGGGRRGRGGRRGARGAAGARGGGRRGARRGGRPGARGGRLGRAGGGGRRARGGGRRGAGGGRLGRAGAARGRAGAASEKALLLMRVGPFARPRRIKNNAETTVFLSCNSAPKRAKMSLRRGKKPPRRGRQPAPAKAPRPAPTGPRPAPDQPPDRDRPPPPRTPARRANPGDPPQPARSRGLSGCPLRPTLFAGRPAESPKGKEKNERMNEPCRAHPRFAHTTSPPDEAGWPPAETPRASRKARKETQEVSTHDEPRRLHAGKVGKTRPAPPSTPRPGPHSWSRPAPRRPRGSTLTSPAGAAARVARAAESLTDLLDPEKAENDPEIFRAHIRLTDIAKEEVCAAADSLVALADARNHTIRR